MPSVHIYGKKDEYIRYMNEHRLYSKPIIMYHEEDHKFPKALSDEDFSKLKIFLSKQYKLKFGSEEDF